MRFWPLVRHPRYAIPASLPFAQEALRRQVEDVLLVKEEEVRGLVLRWGGHLVAAPARALPIVEQRFRPYGFTPFLKREKDVTWIEAVPLANVVARSRPGLAIGLFLLTVLSTLVAGGLWSNSLPFVTFDPLKDPMQLLRGAPFALTLLGILGTHEFGHYFTARSYGASVSLPYFIPAPPPLPFGTLGAVIVMRSPARDRNSLFDIAAAGPLAGLAVALPACLLGFAWSSVVPAPAGGYVAFGDSLFTWGIAYLRFGHIPPGYMLFTHPMADAAWAGFLVTALNLFPVGQLDGGRIAYALFGRRHRTIGKATVAGLLLFGAAAFFWGLRTPGGDVVSALASSLNWFVWAGLISLLVGFHHSPPLDDLSPISPGRRVVGIACLVLMVLLIPPPLNPLVAIH